MLLMLAAVAVGVDSLAQQAAVPSRTLLLIHGSGTDAGAFVSSPTAVGAKNFLSAIPPRRRDPQPWQFTSVDAGSDDGSWFRPGRGGPMEGIEKSIAVVEAAIEERQVAGIVGHEQGGTLAAIVAARSALGLGPRLGFAVLCGAAFPRPMEEMFQTLRDSPDASIPTLHCLSTSDTASPCEQGEELAGCFASAEILWHDGGSAMPGRSWWKDSMGFPDRVSGRTQYTAGMYG